MQKTTLPSINAHMVVAGLAWVVSQAVAFGVLNTGVAQIVVAAGGIVIPAAYAIAQALHLSRVHAAAVAQVLESQRMAAVPVAPSDPTPAPAPPSVKGG